MQVPKSDRVRRYELTYLVPGSFTSDLVSQTQSAVDASLKKHQFASISKEEWGKKALAYPIKHGSKRETEATYMHQIVEAHSDKVAALDAELRLNQNLMRYLLVIEEKVVATPAAAAPQEEATEQE